MRRKIVVTILVILCFILQNTVFKALSLASVSPNLLLVVTASFGLMRGEKEGLWIGFFSGLLIDIFYGGILGFYALLYMFLGYGNGIFHRLFLDEDIKLPMVWIGFSDLAYGLLVYFFRFMLRGQFDFGYYFVHVILPELVYTVVVTLGLYWVIRVINAWLEKGEDDSHKGYGTISAASAAALMGGTDQSEEF